MEKFVDGGCWDNFSLMEPLVKQVSWFSEEDITVHKILSLKLKFATCGGKGPELKLRELLELAKFNHWSNAKRVAARALAALSPK